MRVSCSLRRIRGKRTLEAIRAESGVHIAELSKIERGIAFPRDEWLPALERAYGAPRHEWYQPELLVQLERDEAA